MATESSIGRRCAAGNFLIHQVTHRYSQARACFDKLAASELLLLGKT